MSDQTPTARPDPMQDPLIAMQATMVDTWFVENPSDAPVSTVFQTCARVAVDAIAHAHVDLRARCDALEEDNRRLRDEMKPGGERYEVAYRRGYSAGWDSANDLDPADALGSGSEPKAKPRRKCPVKCSCICHDTGGSGHDHEGQPCPGKLAGSVPEAIDG